MNEKEIYAALRAKLDNIVTAGVNDEKTRERVKEIATAYLKELFPPPPVVEVTKGDKPHTLTVKIRRSDP